MIIDKNEKQRLFESMRDGEISLEHKTSRVKMCIYGPSGAGKTVTAVALARKLIGPDKWIVFVDKSEGWESLRNHKSLMKNVKPVAYESLDQLYVLAESIYRKIAPFDNVGAVIFDDADMMASQELNDLWHKRVALGTSTLDPDKPERPEYLKLGFSFTEVLEFIYAQTPNVHVFLTTQANEKKNKEGVVLGSVPGFNPALSSLIKARLQVLAFMSAKEVKGGERDVAKYDRVLQVHPTFSVDAKSRIGFTNVRIEVSQFINHVYDWVMEGKPQESEADALRMEIAAVKVDTKDDLLGEDTIVDDDQPVFFEN